jgi:hypothetical protein
MLVALQAAPSPHLILPVAQIWVIVVSAFSPLLGYVLNNKVFRAKIPEPMKAFVQVLLAGIAAGITTAVATPDFGVNSATLQLVVTGIVTALGAHGLLWKPSGVAGTLTQ